MKISEAQFQRTVTETAELCGWRVLHVLPSQLRGRHVTSTTVTGWVDLVLWKKGHPILFRELKSEKGRVTADQRAVISSLDDAGADVGVWRPSDWVVIEETLRRRADAVL